jgi:HSP20 family protein
MTLVLRRPADARRARQVLDAAFNGWPFAPEGGNLGGSTWIPATDIFEYAEGIKITLELPGLSPAEVKLTLENNTLTIRGEKQQKPEEKSAKVHRYERSYGAFERSFALPTTVDSDKVTAKFEHGVLTVTLPTAEQAKPREIQVKVS